MRQQTGLQFYILWVSLAATGLAWGETLRQVEVINGAQYTVQYSIQKDGNLKVQPTHIYTTRGWFDLGPQPQLPVDAANLKGEGRRVTVGGRVFSVRYSVSGGRTLGEAYAEWKNQEWVYLPSPSQPSIAATPSPKSQSTKPAGSRASPRPAAAASPSSSNPVAELRVYQSAVKNFGATVHENAPYLDEKNREVRPNIHIGAGAQIADSSNSIHLQVQVDVTGTAETSEGKRVLGAESGAIVRSFPEVTTQQSIFMTQNGVATGQPRRIKNNMPFSVTPYSEFSPGLMRALALRKARRMGTEQTRAVIPSKQIELENHISTGTQKIVQKVNENLRQGMADLSGFTDELQNQGAPTTFGVRLSSRSGGDNGYIEVALTSPSAKNLKPRPALKPSMNQAASLYLNQVAIDEAIKPLLAGKTIKLGEAMRVICEHRLMKRIELCEKPNRMAATTELHFDQDDPFQVRFEDGKIQLELNALHRTAALASSTPYQVVITYAIRPTGLERTGVVAQARVAGAEQKKNLAASAPSKDSDDKKAHSSTFGFFNQALRSFAPAVEKTAIEAAYAKEFREAVVLPTAQEPTRVHVQNARQGGAPQIAETSNFRQGQMVAADGWLAVGYDLVK